MMSGVMNNEVYNHHLTGMTPDEIAQHFKDICPEFGDLNADEVLFMQESAFQYVQINKQKKDLISGYGETSHSSSVSAHENESLSHGTSVENQLALDEDLARALELGDDFNDFCIHEHDVGGIDNTRSTVRESPIRAENRNIRQDDFDPDRMTYEELQSLGESVGWESRGLSEDLISRLPTFKYKVSLFSKKKKEKEDCVICCAEYKNGAKLTTLPCAHQYHSNCITPWLQQSKQCPICQKEVQDE